MGKLAIAVALAVASFGAVAADDQCVTTVTTITDSAGVPLPASGQLIDRVCGLDAETALKGYYVRKALIGQMYVDLVTGDDGAPAGVVSVYGD